MIWRGLLVLSAILLVIGGPMHPGGATMAEMLADPDWIPAHAIILAGFLVLLGGIVAYRRGRTLPGLTDRWSRYAVAGTALMSVEMVVHTAAAVDAANAAAGLSTPVLTTHLWMARTIYPAFGILMAGFILATARDRAIGLRWIAPLGILGALAWGAAPPAATWVSEDAAILFPVGLMSLAAWVLLAGLWPSRGPEPAPTTI